MASATRGLCGSVSAIAVQASCPHCVAFFIQPSSMRQASLSVACSRLGTAPMKPLLSITLRKRTAALCPRASAMACSAAACAVLLASRETRILV